MMEMPQWFKMTPQERINEVGDEPDCPFCKKPRVTRSDYIRCNHCGVNWLEGQDISRDPRTKVIASATQVVGSGAQTASATPSEAEIALSRQGRYDPMKTAEERRLS